MGNLNCCKNTSEDIVIEIPSNTKTKDYIIDLEEYPFDTIPIRVINEEKKDTNIINNNQEQENENEKKQEQKIDDNNLPLNNGVAIEVEIQDSCNLKDEDNMNKNEEKENDVELKDNINNYNETGIKQNEEEAGIKENKNITKKNEYEKESKDNEEDIYVNIPKKDDKYEYIIEP